MQIPAVLLQLPSAIHFEEGKQLHARGTKSMVGWGVGPAVSSPNQLTCTSTPLRKRTSATTQYARKQAGRGNRRLKENPAQGGGRILTQFRSSELGLMRHRVGEIGITKELIPMPVIRRHAQGLGIHPEHAANIRAGDEIATNIGRCRNCHKHWHFAGKKHHGTTLEHIQHPAGVHRGCARHAAQQPWRQHKRKGEEPVKPKGRQG